MLKKKKNITRPTFNFHHLVQYTSTDCTQSKGKLGGLRLNEEFKIAHGILEL